MSRKSISTIAVQAQQAERQAEQQAEHESAQVFDLESRLDKDHHEDHHQSLRLWLRMLSCTVLVEDRIRSRLRSEFGITLPRFDLMAQLERHPDGLRMGELSKRMMVTGGNITGITDQLEQEKLVVRVPDPNDRRAFSVKLTPAGRRAFRRMAAVHEGWIEEMLGGLSAGEKGALIDLLSKIKHHLNGPAAENHE
ncbi:MarR family transcriptional regulator [Noviherbaspirillum sp. CPCC 100848]|uniref:MarR family transcriptional regulator n=1 Tax=Noviherbaspirillum album TaxID=3080276 RepID=A0ABU6J8A5_9BURK|nr:MarR family transcriptional regulator [Noviherbaspirillum sp. CPCC 100848]MEC4719760.1 MarR family transcriptional regulator [Noviherbaspirillum sp. CPCC 100848]